MAQTNNTIKPYEFEVNGDNWKIIQVPTIEDDASILGVTTYYSRTISLLDWVDRATKIRTLKHELTHVWLWEYGHNQQEKEFNHEDICEIVASSNDFINNIVTDYFKGGK